MSRPRCRSLGVLALLAGGCVATGASESAEDALTNATEHDGDPAVVALVPAGGEAALLCTGTLIAPRVVLTAAHCVPPSGPAPEAVLFGPRVDASGDRVAVLATAAHPSYGGRDADHDLALLLLAEPAPTAPVPLLEDPLAGPLPIPARLVGFGRTGGDASDYGRKREGRGEIIELLETRLALGPAPSLPCNGDSGGPVFVETAAGERLAGVTSRGDPGCSIGGWAALLRPDLETFVAPQLAAWEPGSRAPGERCLYDDHCVDALCVEALDEPALRFCSAPCASSGECREPLECAPDEGVCRHPLPSPGALGGACEAGGECAQGDCVVVDERSVCSTRCVSGRDDCAAGSSCLYLGGIDFYCVRDPEPRGDGCSVAPPGTGRALAWLGIVAAALAWAAVRRRRRTPPRVFKDRTAFNR